MLNPKLPDGSKFTALYDASQTKWTGTLTVGEVVFTESASAVFTLVNRLAERHEKSLRPAKDQASAQPSAPTLPAAESPMCAAPAATPKKRGQPRK